MNLFSRTAAILAIICVPILMGSNCRRHPTEDTDSTGNATPTPPEVELQVVSIDPATEPANQAFRAMIYGSKFAEGARVFFGNIEATRVDVRGENSIIANGPGLPAGVYDVLVVNADSERAILRSGLTVAEPVIQEDCSHITVYFDYDKADLKSDSISALGAKTGCLARSSGNIKVEGHCDERGTEQYNISLGERRAYAVQRYLTSQGVSPARVSTISYGEERPAVKGSTEAAFAQNRRAEVSLSK